MKNMGYQKAAASFLFQKTANDISRFGHCLRRSNLSCFLQYFVKRYLVFIRDFQASKSDLTFLALLTLFIINIFISSHLIKLLILFSISV